MHIGQSKAWLQPKRDCPLIFMLCRQKKSLSEILKKVSMINKTALEMYQIVKGLGRDGCTKWCFLWQKSMTIAWFWSDGNCNNNNYNIMCSLSVLLLQCCFSCIIWPLNESLSFLELLFFYRSNLWMLFGGIWFFFASIFVTPLTYHLFFIVFFIVVVLYS